MDDPHNDQWPPEEAIRYDEFAARSFSWLYIEKPSLQALIEPYINQRTIALDLGCGGGRIIDLLCQLGVAEASVFGLDSSSTLLGLARERFPAATVIRGELTEPPYGDIPSHSVDIVTTHLVLQYLGTSELSACLGEVRRLLKTGGQLAVGLPHPMRVNEQAAACYFTRQRQLVSAPWGGVTAYAGLTIADYVNAAIDAGFCLARMDEPEIADDGLRHDEAGHYSPGPTRLMMLLRAASRGYSM
jgi:trans-aconitate methyltransferase